MYLYHHVPNNQTGSIIYPLNQLKEKFPEIYSQQYSKYDNIKEKDVEIPGFGYWNDCVNLMPVNPGLVKKELEKYGHDTNWAWRFYRIAAESLDSSKLIIMVMTETNVSFERLFIPFDIETFDKYCHIGEVTRKVFQKAKDNNEQPNTFARIPHVLFKSSIDTRDIEIIEF
jgi:hypothetical protein